MISSNFKLVVSFDNFGGGGVCAGGGANSLVVDAGAADTVDFVRAFLLGVKSDI